MKNSEINIRDPFVLTENGRYYMIGTRGKDFGIRTGGFDVYVGTDLENWSSPIEIFNSAKFGLNKDSNWAPEIHFFRGKYYVLQLLSRRTETAVPMRWSAISRRALSYLFPAKR